MSAPKRTFYDLTLFFPFAAAHCIDARRRRNSKNNKSKRTRRHVTNINNSSLENWKLCLPIHIRSGRRPCSDWRISRHLSHFRRPQSRVSSVRPLPLPWPTLFSFIFPFLAFVVDSREWREEIDKKKRFPWMTSLIKFIWYEFIGRTDEQQRANDNQPNEIVAADKRCRFHWNSLVGSRWFVYYLFGHMNDERWHTHGRAWPKHNLWPSWNLT